jgi:methyl coenzyme M reductase subunit C
MHAYDHAANDRDCVVDMASHMCTGKGSSIATSGSSEATTLSEWNRVMTLLTGGGRIWDGTVVQVTCTLREQAVNVEIEHLYDTR